MAKDHDIFQTYSLDGAIIGKMIDDIGRHTKRGVRMIQVAATSAALHAVKHGDTTLLTRLFDTMGNAWFRSSLAKWVQTHTPLRYSTSDKGFVKVKDAEKFAAFKAELEANEAVVAAKLLETPWDAAAEDKGFQGFDLLKQAKSLLARAKQVLTDPEKADHKDNKIDSDLLKALTRLVAEGDLARTVNAPAVKAAEAQAIAA